MIFLTLLIHCHSVAEDRGPYFNFPKARLLQFPRSRTAVNSDAMTFRMHVTLDYTNALVTFLLLPVYSDGEVFFSTLFSISIKSSHCNSYVSYLRLPPSLGFRFTPRKIISPLIKITNLIHYDMKLG